MALSGNITNWIHSGHYTLRISWSATQNITANTSTITAKMYLVQDPSWSLSIASRSNTCTIDGVVTSFTSPKISSNGGSTILLGTVSRVVNHNADGSRNVGISATFNINASISGTKYTSITASATVALDTIPRVSSFSLSASSVVLGNPITISITRQSTAFTHRIKYSWGQQSGTIASGVATSQAWTVPLNFANYIPNGTSGTCFITVETMNGSSVIGSQTKSFTGTVPTSIVPSITSVTLTDPSGNVPESFGGMFVKGKSTLRVVTAAAGAYGSTISSYSVQANGATYSSNDVTTGVLSISGTMGVTITVTDSRGRTATTTRSITIHDYHTPIISTFDVKRVTASGADDDEGDHVMISYETIRAVVGGKNGGSMAIYYKASNDVNWITAAYEENIPSAISDSIIVSGISVDSTYDVRIDVADSFVSSSRSAQVPTASVVIDCLADGTGIGIGKVAEYSDMLDVGWNARFRKSAQFDGGVTSRGNALYPVIAMTVHRNASNQNLATANTYEPIKWTHSTSVGTGLSLNSDGAVVIGEGVSVVRVSGQLTVGAQVNGMKYAAIWLNVNTHLSRAQAQITTAAPQTINFAPKLVNVSPGDVIAVRLYGAQGDVMYGGTMQSYFTVEAVG